jgi:hypothetical protein
MARTVWGAHKRYMDTYLNVYKGYYVSIRRLAAIISTNLRSSLEMVLGVTTKVTTGSGDVLMMLSTSPVTDSLLLRSRQRSSSIVCLNSIISGMQLADNAQTKWLKPPWWASMTN